MHIQLSLSLHCVLKAYYFWSPKNQSFWNKSGKAQLIRTKFSSLYVDCTGHGVTTFREFWAKWGVGTSPAEPDFFLCGNPDDLSLTSQWPIFTKFGRSEGAISVAFVSLSHTCTLRIIREPKSLACPNLELRFPTLDATHTPVSRSNRQRSGLQTDGGIPCRVGSVCRTIMIDSRCGCSWVHAVVFTQKACWSSWSEVVVVVVVSGNACNSIRLRSAIRRHHPPQRAVLSQICCFVDVSDPVGRCWLLSHVMRGRSQLNKVAQIRPKWLRPWDRLHLLALQTCNLIAVGAWLLVVDKTTETRG